MGCDGCHSGHVFFDSFDIFFVDFEVLLLLANYDLVGGFKRGDKITCAFNDRPKTLNLRLSQEVASLDIILVQCS